MSNHTWVLVHNSNLIGKAKMKKNEYMSRCHRATSKENNKYTAEIKKKTKQIKKHSHIRR